MPPLSSKKRSAMTVVRVGTAPKIARPATTYSTACSAPASSSPHSSLSQLSAALASVVNCPLESEAARGTKELIISRNSETCAESSSVRAGASPRRNGRWRSLRVFHQDAARRDSPDPPGSASQQHDVASDALYGEVFIYRSHDCAFGLCNHGVQRILWNVSAAGDRSQTTATAGADDAVHAIAMKVCRITSARTGDAFGKHSENLIEVRARKTTIRIGTAHSL